MGAPGDKDNLVLIIDDDDGVRELLLFLVRKEGYRADAAYDGEDGLKKAERLSPDLIILDLMLPRHGGFELLRQLQGSELSKIPIIVITGRYTDRATADMICQESNVVEFLEKPIKQNALAATLRRILGSGSPAPEFS
ncbi:MAG: response regulator [Elusimicrobiota bacterium]